MNKIITKEQLCDEIIRIYNQEGYMNTVILKEKSNFKINNYLLHKYHGLQFLCNELDIPFTFNNRQNHQDVINDLLRVYNEQNYLSVEIYKKYGKYSVTCVKNHFNGSFNTALEKLGLPINMYKNVTKDDIKEDVLKFFEDKKVSSTLYRKDGKYSQCTIDRLFGSWKNLMKELNLPYTDKDYGFDEMLRQVDNVRKKYGYINRTLIDEECDFTYQALFYYIKDKSELCNLLNDKNLFPDTLSVKADILKKVLTLLYGEENVESEKTWRWLKNNKTRKNLYIDFYIKKINIAFEYDGEQNYKMYTSFYRTEKDFKDAKERDELKNKLLKEHNIDLIRIPYDFEICERTINGLIIDKILKRYKKYEEI